VTVATLTSKGQITLPKDIRDRLGLKPGDRLDFRVDEEGVITARRRKSLKIQDLFGILPNNGVHLTVEEMNDAIAEAVIEKYERSLPKR
jgi:antitoxin PrlF